MPKIEDFLVSLADNCWKVQRVEELEPITLRLLSKESGLERWQACSALDEILQELAAAADAGLLWQMSFPVE